MISLPNPNREPRNCSYSMSNTSTMNYYKVTNIEFDFDGEDLTSDEQNEIIEEAKSCLWTSPTENDLVDTITNNMGWCIKSLQYEVIPA